MLHPRLARVHVRPRAYRTAAFRGVIILGFSLFSVLSSPVTLSQYPNPLVLPAARPERRCPASLENIRSNTCAFAESQSLESLHRSHGALASGAGEIAFPLPFPKGFERTRGQNVTAVDAEWRRTPPPDQKHLPLFLFSHFPELTNEMCGAIRCVATPQLNHFDDVERKCSRLVSDRNEFLRQGPAEPTSSKMQTQSLPSTTEAARAPAAARPSVDIRFEKSRRDFLAWVPRNRFESQDASVVISLVTVHSDKMIGHTFGPRHDAESVVCVLASP